MRGLFAAETVDRDLVPGSKLGVPDAETFSGGQTKNAYFALVCVAVYFICGLPGLG